MNEPGGQEHCEDEDVAGGAFLQGEDGDRASPCPSPRDSLLPSACGALCVPWPLVLLLRASPRGILKSAFFTTSCTSKPSSVQPVDPLPTADRPRGPPPPSDLLRALQPSGAKQDPPPAPFPLPPAPCSHTHLPPSSDQIMSPLSIGPQGPLLTFRIKCPLLTPSLHDARGPPPPTSRLPPRLCLSQVAQLHGTSLAPCLEPWGQLLPPDRPRRTPLVTWASAKVPLGGAASLSASRAATEPCVCPTAAV